MILQLHSLSFPRAAARARSTGIGALLLGPTVLFAAPPVINLAAPEQHYYYAPEESSGTQFGFVISASNSPTSFDAVGLPANATINRTTGTISGALNVPGVFPLTLSAANADGTGTAALKLVLHPGFISVTTARGEYTAGQSFTISVTCNRPLVVTGAPAISFLIGSASRSATYASGSGSSTIVFKYTVVAGDSSNGQDIQLRGLDTTAGTLRDGDGLEPSPRLPLRYFSSGVKISAPTAVAPTPSATSTTPPTASTTTPPAATPTTVTPTTITPGSQTIAITAPVGSIVMGQPLALSATASSGLPVVFSVVSGPATINGSAVTITAPGAVVVRATQPGANAVSAANAEITLNAGRAAQVVSFAPTKKEISPDRTLELAASSSSGLPVTFEVVSGPATIKGSTLTPTGAGLVTLRAKQAGSDTFSAAEATTTITISPATRLINLSSRVHVRDGDPTRSLIAGFVVSGGAEKQILVRAVGPTLASFGLQSALTNPRLRILDPSGRVVAENDDWSGGDTAAAFARLGAFGLSAGSRDAALLVSLPAGAYSLQVIPNGGEGVALAEIYDASDTAAESQTLINLSTRAHVDTGESVLTAGFVVTGTVPKRVLIRGVGPALDTFGVAGALADPVLKVFSGQLMVAQNDNWQTPQTVNGIDATTPPSEIAAAASTAGAFPLASGSKDAAVVVTLPPGAYTAVVSGANNSSGAGLVEVYELSTPSQ